MENIINDNDLVEFLKIRFEETFLLHLKDTKHIKSLMLEYDYSAVKCAITLIDWTYDSSKLTSTDIILLAMEKELKNDPNMML
tara:strand:- start:1699 stop:1947 length:249 start_codon:yes stop_codon:yes gene_type:complete